MPPLPFDKLNETNYDDWKIQMEALLEEKSLFGVVCSRDVMPTTGPNSKGVKSFLEKQRLARSKIILAVEPSQLPHIRSQEDPAVIWQNLARIHRARGLGVLLTMRMDFLKLTLPPGSTISSFVAQIRHAAYRLEESYRAEEGDTDSSPSPSTPQTPAPPIVSELDKISVLLNGLPPIYQPVIVSITGTPVSQLNFEGVVTRLMNEEGRLRNVAPQPTAPPSSDKPERDPRDEVYAVTAGQSNSKGKFRDMSKVICHKCRGVGHLRTVCPTRDSDAANAAEENQESTEESFTAVDDEDEGTW